MCTVCALKIRKIKICSHLSLVLSQLRRVDVSHGDDVEAAPLQVPEHSIA